MVCLVELDLGVVCDFGVVCLRDVFVFFLHMVFEVRRLVVCVLVVCVLEWPMDERLLPGLMGDRGLLLMDVRVLLVVIRVVPSSSGHSATVLPGIL